MSRPRRFGYRGPEGVNRLFGRAGIAVDTADRRRIAERRSADVREIHEWLRTAVLHDLQPREGRVELLAQLRRTSTSQGVFVAHAVQRALRSGGDVCGFGVAGGEVSALLANEIRDTDCTLWLFESLEPASPRGAQLVGERLAAVGFPRERTRLVAGPVERDETRAQMPERVAFAYLDIDLSEPTAVALDLVHEPMGVGGRMVVDDFGVATSGAEKAVNEFLRRHSREYELTVPPSFAGAFCILARVA